MTPDELVDRIKTVIVGTDYPDVDSDAVRRAEDQLGFPLPALLKALYSRVGNGGFGPQGATLVGLEGGCKSDVGLSLVGNYLLQRANATERFRYQGSDVLGWPEKLLVAFEWPCNYYSCLDCSRPETPVYVWHPGLPEGMVQPIFEHKASLLEWLSAPFENVDLWEEMEHLEKAIPDRAPDSEAALDETQHDPASAPVDFVHDAALPVSPSAASSARQTPTVADEEQLRVLRQGAEAWNAWRNRHPEVATALSRAKLRGAELNGVDLRRTGLREIDLIAADLTGANLEGADMTSAGLCAADLKRAHMDDSCLRWASMNHADLSQANLTNADLSGADLNGARLCRSRLRNAELSHANLTDAVLSHADLTSANLSGADLSGADLRSAAMPGANLNGCRVYGVAAITANLRDAEQRDLIVTPTGHSTIAVDGLVFAQFVQLLLGGADVLRIVETLVCRAVLILGCFRPKRPEFRDGLRDALRKRGYVPILVDFDKPDHFHTEESLAVLAGIVRFVAVDFTAAATVQDRLVSFVLGNPSASVLPLIPTDTAEDGVFDAIEPCPGVLAPCRYETAEQAVAGLAARLTDA